MPLMMVRWSLAGLPPLGLGLGNNGCRRCHCRLVKLPRVIGLRATKCRVMSLECFYLHASVGFKTLPSRLEIPIINAYGCESGNVHAPNEWLNLKTNELVFQTYWVSLVQFCLGEQGL